MADTAFRRAAGRPSSRCVTRCATWRVAQPNFADKKPLSTQASLFLLVWEYQSPECTAQASGLMIGARQETKLRVTPGYDVDVKQHHCPSPIFLDSSRFVCYFIK